MLPAPQFRALRDELDAALSSLQLARRLLADVMNASGAEQPQGGSGESPSASVTAPGLSLRYSGMTVAQAAVVLGVGEEQVRRLLRRGELEGVSLGGKAGWRLDPAYVREVAAQWSALREAQQALRAKQFSVGGPSRPTTKPKRRG